MLFLPPEPKVDLSMVPNSNSELRITTSEMRTLYVPRFRILQENDHNDWLNLYSLTRIFVTQILSLCIWSTFGTQIRFSRTLFIRPQYYAECLLSAPQTLRLKSHRQRNILQSRNKRYTEFNRSCIWCSHFLNTRRGQLNVHIHIRAGD